VIISVGLACPLVGKTDAPGDIEIFDVVNLAIDINHAGFGSLDIRVAPVACA